MIGIEFYVVGSEKSPAKNAPLLAGSLRYGSATLMRGGASMFAKHILETTLDK